MRWCPRDKFTFCSTVCHRPGSDSATCRDITRPPTSTSSEPPCVRPFPCVQSTIRVSPSWTAPTTYTKTRIRKKTARYLSDDFLTNRLCPPAGPGVSRLPVGSVCSCSRNPTIRDRWNFRVPRVRFPSTTGRIRGSADPLNICRRRYPSVLQPHRSVFKQMANLMHNPGHSRPQLCTRGLERQACI